MRDENAVPAMFTLRLALRTLLKTPGFTALAVITLGIAIGACTALFSVLQAVVLRPLPFPSPQTLVSIFGLNAERNFEAPAVSWAKYELFRQRTDVFADLAISAGSGFTLTQGKGAPEQVFGLQTSFNFLSVLGLAPSHGRGFLPAEDTEGAPPLRTGVVLVAAGLVLACWDRSVPLACCAKLSTGCHRLIRSSSRSRWSRWRWLALWRA
jgi:hypothetical protein